MNNARTDNTLFVTVCDYPNPAEMCATLRRTADHFGIPLSFASWGGRFADFYDKIPKVHHFLKMQPDPIEYVFQLDCTDVVFTDTVENILASFNEVYTPGTVLFQRCAEITRPLGLYSYVVVGEIAKNFSRTGLGCGGLFCGECSAVFSLLERCIALKKKIQDRDTSDPLVALYLRDPYSQNDLSLARGMANDELFYHLIMAGEPHRIKVDDQKRLLSMLRGALLSQADEPALSLEHRRGLSPFENQSLGTARILHRPGLRDREPWDAWVDQNILIN